MESQFIPISHTIQLSQFSTFNAYMHTYKINFNITIITKITTNHEHVKSKSVAWRATLSREAVQGETQKIGPKHMCRLAVHELPPSSFWKNPKTRRKTRRGKVLHFKHDPEHISYDSRIITRNKNSPNLDS